MDAPTWFLVIGGLVAFFLFLLPWAVYLCSRMHIMGHLDGILRFNRKRQSQQEDETDGRP